MKLVNLLKVIGLTDNVIITKRMDNRPIAKGYADDLFESLDESILEREIVYVHARDDIRHGILIVIN